MSGWVTRINRIGKTLIRVNPVPLWRERGAALVPILRYHSLDDSGSCISTPVARWRRHLEYLRELGLCATSLADYFGRDPAERRDCVVVTFDDGYANNYEVACADLAALGWSGTFFVVSDLVGGRPEWLDRELGELLEAGVERLDGPLPAFLDAARVDSAYAARNLPDLWALGERRCLEEVHALARLRRLPLADWDALRELARAGMDVGSHTRTHCQLGQLDTRAAMEELESSKAEIEARIGGTADWFCYPYGNVPPGLPQLVRDAGYAGACSCERGYSHPDDDRFALRRIDMETVDDADLDLFLNPRHRGVVDRLL